jgi:hypothetical protein
MSASTASSCPTTSEIEQSRSGLVDRRDPCRRPRRLAPRHRRRATPRPRPATKRRTHLDARHQLRFRFIGPRNDHPFEPGAYGREHGREHTRDRSDSTVEPEFADMNGSGDRARFDRSAGSQGGDGDPEVEPGPVFGKARRRQVHCEPASRQVEPGVLAGVVHALDGLPQRLVRQPDDPELGCLVRQVGFDFDEMPVDPAQGDGPGARCAHAMSTRCSSASDGRVSTDDADRLEPNRATTSRVRDARRSRLARAATADGACAGRSPRTGARTQPFVVVFTSTIAR